MKVLDMKIPKLRALSALDSGFPCSPVEYNLRKFVSQGLTAAIRIKSKLKSKLGVREKEDRQVQRRKIFSEHTDCNRVLNALTHDPDIPEELLKQINSAEEANKTEDISYKTLQRKRLLHVLANNATTPSNLLDHISTSEETHLLVCVAGNENISPLTLHQLANHTKAEVRAAVADNKITSLSLITKLCQDEDPDVRFAMAENPHLPPSLLQQLTTDDNAYVAARACATLKRVLQTNVKDKILLSKSAT